MKPKKSHYVLLVAIPAVLAGILVFDNFDFNVAPKQDSNFSVSALNPFQTYNVNNDCELYQALTNVHKWTVFFLSGERLKEKYADEYSKYSHLNSDQQKMFINLVNSGNSPEGFTELAMTITMTEFSINPKYREELTEVFSTASPQPMSFGVSGKYIETLYYRALIEDPDCIKNTELVWGSQLTEEDIEILKKHYQITSGETPILDVDDIQVKAGEIGLRKGDWMKYQIVFSAEGKGKEIMNEMINLPFDSKSGCTYSKYEWGKVEVTEINGNV